MSTVLEVFDAVINTAWQAVLIAGFTWVLLRYSRKYNAATRCAIWWITLGVVLVLPFGIRLVSFARPHAASSSRSLGQPADVVQVVIDQPAPLRISIAPNAVWPWAVFWAWFATLQWRLAQIGWSYWYLRGVKKRAVALGIGLPEIGRCAMVLVSRELESPMAIGFLPPAVILPESLLTNLPEIQREHILLHEAAHIARYDDWSNFVLRILGGVLALHPLAIWILRQIECEREMACDDWVAAKTGAPRLYAQSLAHFMEIQQARRGPVLAPGFLGGKSRIRQRIEMLLRQGRTYSTRTSRRSALTSAMGLAALMLAGSAAPHWIALAQQGGTPEWQSAAGGKMAFEVASVKPLAPGVFHPPTFPLDSSDAYRFNGGRFSATFPLIAYISFAYKISLAPDQRKMVMAHLPPWAATENFDIEARAPTANPTKDQMRLMMQSLLVERFHLALHFEQKAVLALALVSAKKGKLGPQLVPHALGPPCDATPAADNKRSEDIFPESCDVYSMQRQSSGMSKAGSRNTTMELLASAIPTFGSVSQPVVNRTGMTGKFDFTLEWVPDSPPGAPNATPAGNGQPEMQGATFFTALHEQLGLKLQPVKAVIPVLIVDRVDRPSAN